MLAILFAMFGFMLVMGGGMVQEGNSWGFFMIGSAIIPAGGLIARLQRMVEYGLEGVKLADTLTLQNLRNTEYEGLPVYITPGSRIAAVGEVYVCKFNGQRVLMLNAKEDAHDSERPTS
jgi:hypothetical protein